MTNVTRLRSLSGKDALNVYPKHLMSINFVCGSSYCKRLSFFVLFNFPNFSFINVTICNLYILLSTSLIIIASVFCFHVCLLIGLNCLFWLSSIIVSEASNRKRITSCVLWDKTVFNILCNSSGRNHNSLLSRNSLQAHMHALLNLLRHWTVCPSFLIEWRRSRIPFFEKKILIRI